MNILITSAGRRVSLVRSFQKELRKIDKEAMVFAADAKPELSSACQISDKSFAVKRLDHPAYAEDLLRLCIENKIDVVIPTIDTELKLLAEVRETFLKKGVQVVVSDPEFVKICRNKRETNRFFNGLGIETAREIDKQHPDFPLFVKPIDGSSSIDTYKVENERFLSKYHKENTKLMFLEYLDPKEHIEYTVDLYYDRHSELKCVVPRQRIEVRGGEVSKGVTRKNFLVKYLPEKMNRLEGARGCLTLQVFVNTQSSKVTGIEINPRFGGGYPLSYLAGANFSKWIIDEYFFNKKIDYFDGWEDNLLMLRYDDEVLVHGASIK